jgi:hypothetical protein
MNLLRYARSAAVSLVVVSATLSLVACGDGKESKSAKVASGPMPEGESWTGVYFHPVYGYLHLVEEGPTVVGRWKRADQSHWGELSGTKSGNVLHYQWKEHKIGMIGAAEATQGKGYFVYKLDNEQRPILEGQFGMNEDETGTDWRNMKQTRMEPDLKSIGGDAEGASTSGF